MRIVPRGNVPSRDEGSRGGENRGESRERALERREARKINRTFASECILRIVHRFRRDAAR